MTIVVATPLSRRLDRLIGDICALLHDDRAEARERARRWIAHVLADAAGRRRWEFLQKQAATLLAGGQDLVELRGDLDRITAVYAAGPRAGAAFNPPVGGWRARGWSQSPRLNKRPLAWVVERRLAAPAAGAPTDYAVDLTPTGQRVHLWPAPTGSKAQTATADAATDLLTAAAHGLATGTRARLSTTGTLPPPLVAGTGYYAIRLSADTLKLATSAANATAGTAVDLTGAGSGSHTLESGLTDFAVLYSAPINIEALPATWETLVLNGVLGMFGRHFDRDALTTDPSEFEIRYEKQLRRAASEHWDLERAPRFDLDTAASDTSAATSVATSVAVPASGTGVGAVTVELGDYPLTVS